MYYHTDYGILYVILYNMMYFWQGSGLDYYWTTYVLLNIHFKSRAFSSLHTFALINRVEDKGADYEEDSHYPYACPLRVEHLGHQTEQKGTDEGGGFARKCEETEKLIFLVGWGKPAYQGAAGRLIGPYKQPDAYPGYPENKPVGGQCRQHGGQNQT